MDITQKERLTRLGDMSKEACSARLVAAREATGLSQLEISAQAGVANNSLNNMERARQFPNRDIMKYYYRAHRIDFNFLMHGDFAQLPMDVQTLLLDRLLARKESGPDSVEDQKERSGSPQISVRPLRS